VAALNFWWGKKEQAGMVLKVGDPAPDFDLAAVEGERQTRVKLSDFRSKMHVVVAFHPLDWTPT
jgi:peroxiredoxin